MFYVQSSIELLYTINHYYYYYYYNSISSDLTYTADWSAMT